MREIDLVTLGKCTDLEHYIGSGVDSEVKAIFSPEGNITQVAKFYRQNWLDREQLELYFRITNEAKIMADRKKIKLYFDFWTGKLDVRVIPFDQTIIVDGEYVGICEAILCKWGDIYRNDRHFNSQLGLLSNRFNEELGVSGINICPTNTRIDKKSKVLFVTDLCDDIVNLKRISLHG